jgi:hypothetical protein
MRLLLQTLSAHVFESGPIVVDNEEHKQYTVVRISEGKERTTALLEVASAMTGIGVLIHEAIIQVCHSRSLAGLVGTCVWSLQQPAPPEFSVLNSKISSLGSGRTCFCLF